MIERHGIAHTPDRQIRILQFVTEGTTAYPYRLYDIPSFK